MPGVDWQCGGSGTSARLPLGFPDLLADRIRVAEVVAQAPVAVQIREGLKFLDQRLAVLIQHVGVNFDIQDFADELGV